MSYFYNNKIYDEYVIDGVINAAQGDVGYKDVIEIFNNESLRLDISNLDMRCSNPFINNQQLSKIVVDWGDGHQDRLSKPILNRSSTIGVYDPISWKQATHLFNVDKRYEYEIAQDNLKQVLPHITITLINTYNDRVKIYIPYKIVYKSIYDIGSHFSMMNANSTNSNLTSYVLKQHKDNTIVITMSRDWRKIYGGDSEIITIKDTTVSPDFSDEFVNEDSIVWDWKSVPQVDLSVTLANDGVSYFYCQFDEVTVNLDTWTPKCYLIGQPNQELKIGYNDIDRELNRYNIYNYNDLEKENLQNGVYKVYLQVVGINEIQGESGVIYKSVPNNEDLKATPAKIITLDGFTPQEDVTTKEFSVNFELGDSLTHDYTIYPEMIKQAYLYLRPKTIVLQGFENPQDADSAIIFSYNLKPLLKEGMMTIPSKSIPNGQYEYDVYVSDVLGNIEEETYTIGITTGTEGEQIASLVPLQKKTFVLDYTEMGTVTDVVCENGNEADRNVWFRWNIKNPTELDKVSFNVYDNEQNEYLFTMKQPYDNFSHEITQNPETHETIIKFNKAYTPEQIPDGSYNVRVSHILDMTNFGGSRTNTNDSYNFDFRYIRPDIEIVRVIPYIKVERNNKDLFIPYLHVDAVEHNNYTLSNMSFNYRLNSQSESHRTKYISELPVDIELSEFKLKKDDGVEFDYQAYNYIDEIYKRHNVLWQGKNAGKYLKRLTDSYGRLLTIPPTPENIISPTSFYQVLGVENSKLTAKDVTLQSVVDVFKTHCITVDGNRYYYADECNHYSWYNTSEIIKPLVFGTKVYQTIPSQDTPNTSKYTRFYGAPFDVDFSKGEVTQLSSVADRFKNTQQISIVKSYDNLHDRGVLTFICENNDNTDENTINAIYEIYNDLSDQLVYSDTFRNGINGKTVTNLPLGVYRVRFIYDSLDTSSVDNEFVLQQDIQPDLKLYVEAEETIGDVEVTKISSGSSSYKISVKWKLFHKDANNLQLHIQDANQNVYTYDVGNYKYYNPVLTFENETTGKIWFTFDSQVVNWTDSKRVQQTVF